MSMDDRGRRYATELLNATGRLDPTEGLQRMHAAQRRNHLATALAVVVLLLIGVLVAAPSLSGDAAPPADQPTPGVSGFGLIVDVPDGWVGDGDYGGLYLRPDTGAAESPVYIHDYVVESVWNPDRERLEDLPTGGFADWLRRNPSFVVESETPVTVAGQEGIIQRYRTAIAAGKTVPMAAGAIRDSLNNGIRLFDAGQVGLATALTIDGQTVVIEAILPYDGGPVAGLTGDDLLSAYTAVLASARVDPTWQWDDFPSDAGDAPPGMNFPTVGDWTAPQGSAPDWSLVDRGSAGPDGREDLLEIRLMQVLGVPDAAGACCVTPRDGMAAWLTRDSGLTVIAETPVDIQQPTAVLELAAPGKDPGQVTGAGIAPIRLWWIGARPEATPTAEVDPGDASYQWEVDRGARLLVAPFQKDDQWYLLVAQLPYYPVEQTPMRPVDQFRADFLAIAEGLDW